MIDWLFWTAYGLGFVGALLHGYADDFVKNKDAYIFVWFGAALWPVLIPLYWLGSAIEFVASGMHSLVQKASRRLNH